MIKAAFIGPSLPNTNGLWTFLIMFLLAASSTTSLSDCVNPNILNHSISSTPGGRSFRKRSSVMLRPNFLTKDDDIDRFDKTERLAARSFPHPEGLDQDFLRYKEFVLKLNSNNPLIHIFSILGHCTFGIF